MGGGYSSDSIRKYINFYNIIKERGGKYPFAIFNFDRESKPGTHWWSFLDIHPRKDLLLFDSFGFAGFKKFIVDTDESIVDKMLFNLQKFNKKDIKINIESLTFSIESYNKISNIKSNKYCKRFFPFTVWICKTKKQEKRKLK